MTAIGMPRAVSQPLPTPSLDNLRRRAALLRETRRFFDAAGYFEVDTPILSSDVVVDAWIEPFIATWRADSLAWRTSPGEPRFLQTSPEFSMKRLLAAGATQIYQLGKVFRNGEVGRRHNPEFTMLEWYRVGDDLDAQLQFTEDYLVHMLAFLPRELTRRYTQHPFERLTYEAAFERFTGVSVLQEPVTTLQELARSRHLVPPPSLSVNDKDGWLNWLLAELIEPQLGHDGPVFLYDYPATQSALAKTVLRPDGIAVARRFELYIAGVEYCNGYDELTDAKELRRRNAEQSAVRATAGLPPLPEESRLLAAMDRGLPESSGVALGFDRLMMLALGADCIAEVIPFAFPDA